RAPALVAPLAPPDPLAQLGPKARHAEVFDIDGPLLQLGAIDRPVPSGLDCGEPAESPPLVEPQPPRAEQRPMPVGPDPPADVSRRGPTPFRLAEPAVAGQDRGSAARHSREARGRLRAQEHGSPR